MWTHSGWESLLLTSYFSLWIMLYSVNLPLSLLCSTLKGGQADILDVHLCCSPIEAPCLTTRGPCLLFAAFWHAPNYYIIPGWLTHPSQCGKQVVPPHAEGSRSRADGFSVSSWEEGDSLASIYSPKLTGVNSMLQITLVRYQSVFIN